MRVLANLLLLAVLLAACSVVNSPEDPGTATATGGTGAGADGGGGTGAGADGGGGSGTGGTAGSAGTGGTGGGPGTAGITVSAASGDTSEDGNQATFTVELDSQPTADVTVHFASNDLTEGVTDVTSLTFTAADWDLAQTVTVTGQDDADADGDQPYAVEFTPTTSGDTDYAGLTPDSVQLTNLDNCDVAPGSQTFTFTGGIQTFTVPACVQQVYLQVYGAEGGSSAVGPSLGGLGGYAEGYLAVTPGETLYVAVGEQGQDSSGNNAGVPGSYNGGGSGGTSIGATSQPGGAAGGGASDVRQGGDTIDLRVIVGAGGGGSGGGTGNEGVHGGAGGGLAGGPGVSYASGLGFEAQGGTQNAGGAAGSYVYGPMNGTSGSLGLGGNGHGEGYSGGGGGGGGWYGGGGGSCHFESGGGGGSSYIGGVTGGSTDAGVRSGHGEVTISW